jgi:uncharacterized protein (DUF736 family)
MRRRAAVWSCVAAVVVILSAGCAKSSDESTVASPSTAPASESVLTLGSVPKSVEGNVVTIPVTVKGITIVKANGDTSGKTGHFHVFIDREPPAIGSVIPKEAGIVHTADNPIKLYGLKVGMHTFHIVLGDGAHKRITNAEESVSVDVKGPSVKASAPATITAGSDLTVGLSAEGVEIVKANGDTSGKTGHYHVLVDPATKPQPGEVIPAAVPDKIIHTAASSTTISGLAKGEHVIWVVLGDGAHKAFDPPVMDKLTVTVT